MRRSIRTDFRIRRLIRSAACAAAGLLWAGSGWTQASDNLPAWTAETNSGAYDAQRGDRFTGPGILTVGRVGAKKQLVLPPGQWVLLSLQDHAVGGAEMTSLSLGRFAGRQLHTLLRVTLNRNVTAVTDWSALDPCARDAAAPLRRVASLPSAVRGECQLVQWLPSAGLDAGVDSAMLRESLDKLGATAAAGPVLSSALLFSERRYGVLRTQRLDWPAVAGQPGATHGEAWLAWYDRYRAVVEAGFRYAHRVDDLEPGVAPKPGTTLALDEPKPAP